jgi:hypothetical protein
VSDTLVVIPTKGRPAQLERLVNSLWKTAAEPVDILLVLSEGEQELYNETVSQLWAYTPSLHINFDSMFVASDATYPDKLNATVDFIREGGHRYVFVPNDDHEAITVGWDRAYKDLIGDEPFGLAYGPDGVWEDGQVPSAPFLTATFVTTLGFLALPGLQHILVDNVWMDLAKALSVCHFTRDVRIQHHHLDNGEAEVDDTYRETQHNDARNREDRMVWWRWLESSERLAQEKSLAALWSPPRQITRPL